MKVTKDFIFYLKEVDKLSKRLSKEQRDDLENILKVMLTLLVALKQNSNLGKLSINWLLGKEKD